MRKAPDRTDLTWELKRVALFASFTPQEIDRLLASGAACVFRARQRLFDEGDPGGSMHVVLSGRVKVAVDSSDGREVVLSFAGPGEVLGELTLLDGGPRTATATALEPTRTFHLARAQVLPLIEQNSGAALHIISLLCERLRATNQMVEDTLFSAAGPRLARTLLRLVDVHGRQDGEAWRLTLGLPQATLGAHAGLLRESVNRQLRAWQDAGILAPDQGKALVILRRDLLEQIAFSA